MKKFLTKCLFFFVLILVLISIGFSIPSNLISESLHYSIFDKHELLISEKETPRIILVGGSSLSFGIYSPLIEQEFNVKVINTGIIAGYGLKFIIDDVKPFIKEGDIVILTPEYSNYYGDIFYGGQAMVRSINIYPDNFKNLDWRQLIKFMKFLPRHSFGKMKSYLLSFFIPMNNINPYHRKAFNSNGDAVYHWGLTKKQVIPIAELGGDYNQDALEYIEEFHKYVKKKNAYMYLSFPCLNKSSFNISEDRINVIYSEVTSTSLNILGTPLDSSTPDSLHFDTHYHLIREGQYLRTEKLIRDLKEHGLVQLINSIK